MTDKIPDLSWPIGCHPLDQAAMWCSVPMNDAQIDFVNAWAMPNSRAVSTFPNSGGKTSVVMPVCVLSAMTAFKGAMVYVTSGSERQLREQFFLQQIVPRIDPLRAKGWKVWRGDEMKVEAPNGSTMLCYVCADAKNVEGFHGYWQKDATGKDYYRPCVYFADECKSISDEVLQGIWRIEPDFFGAVSSPGEANHWMYKAIDPDGLDKTIEGRRLRLSPA